MSDLYDMVLGDEHGDSDSEVEVTTPSPRVQGHGGHSDKTGGEDSPSKTGSDASPTAHSSEKPHQEHNASTGGSDTNHENFNNKHNNYCGPHPIQGTIVDDYRLSAKVVSERGNSCLKNCSTEKDLHFVNNSGKMPEGQPSAFINTNSIEYSDFNPICKEPDKECNKNAQVISMYSPGGLLMKEQNTNVNTTLSGIKLNSSTLSTNQPVKPLPTVKPVGNGMNLIHNSTNPLVEHLTAPAVVKLVLIVFFAAWCPHCKSAKPHLDKLKKKHHGSDIKGIPFTVIEYDADKHVEEISKYNINGYPTYKIFKKTNDGKEEIIDHDGGRTYDDLYGGLMTHCNRN